MERSSASLAFETYWRSLYDGERLPAVSDFDLLAIPDLVPVTLELYIKDGATALSRFRFAGGDVVRSTNVELTDQDYFNYFDHAYKDETLKRMSLIYQLPAGLCQVSPMIFEDGSATAIEMTGFPLQDSENDFAIFGTAVQVGKPITMQPRGKPELKRATERLWIDLGHGTPDDPA